MHIMKTAGTNVAWSIRQSLAPDEVYPGGPPSSEQSPEQRLRYWLLERFDDVDAAARARLRVFMGHFHWFANERFGADEVVTLLRDPVERTISHLRQVQRDPGNEHLSLEALYEGPPQVPTPFANYQVRMFAQEPTDTGPQPLVIDDARYRLAFERLESAAVIGLTEDLGPFWAEVGGRYGWHPSDTRLQVAPKRPPVPDALRKRLERDHAADRQFYAEACELVRRRAPAAR